MRQDGPGAMQPALGRYRGQYFSRCVRYAAGPVAPIGPVVLTTRSRGIVGDNCPPAGPRYALEVMHALKEDPAPESPIGDSHGL